MRKFILFSVAATLLMLQIACSNNGVTTENGNRVVIHTKNDGPKLELGQTGLITVHTYVKDSMVQSTTRDFGGPREVALPTKDQLKGKLPAVFDALLLMAKGDSASVFQPVDSTMEKVIKARFGDVKEIRYEVVLVEIMTPEVLQKRQEEEQAKLAAQEQNSAGVKLRVPEVTAMVASNIAEYKGGKLGSKLQKTASGLEYVIIEQGTGAAIKDGDEIETHYFGALKSNAKRFDDSFSRGMPIPFKVGQLVPGFNEGMKLLNRGGKAILYIPSALGYADQSPSADIPPNSDLVFYLEMGN